MKFDFKMDRMTLIRIGGILLVLALLPFSLELVVLIDLGGIDLALTFLFIYFGAAYNALLVKVDNFKRKLSDFFRFLSQLYMFKPGVFLSHATVSSIVVVFTGSALLACLFWIPLMYLSSGFLM